MAEHDAPGYEQRDVSGFWLLMALLAFLIGFALALLGAHWALQSNLQHFPPPSPVAAQTPPTPPPRLLTNPSAELERFMHEKHARLHSYGWVDREAGLAHIPIEQAMQRVVEYGLPRWPQSGLQSAAQKARDAYQEAPHRAPPGAAP